MTAVPEAILYERQSDPQTKRDCGAACLSMVYCSLGKKVPQDQIWPAIAKRNRFGSLSSTTHLMAQEALSRGFHAVAIQARHPLQALRLCRDSGIRAILNLRPTNDASTGHYTVLVDVDERDVVLHDPFYGPSRRVPHAELLDLWQPSSPKSEITGNVLIGISAEPPASAPCWLCRAPTPFHVACVNCRKPVGLRPSALLGCMNDSCIARMWNSICCPSCDYTWTFSLEATGGTESSDLIANASGAGRSVPGQPRTKADAVTEAGELRLDKVFSELDKFCNHLLRLPEAAGNSEIRRHLDHMTRSKDRIKRAQAEALVHRTAYQEQLAKLTETAKQNEEAHRKRVEALNRPSPPLDGDALGRALLKNLGFID